jgi:ribosomal protein S18 acetylase RimI-like enzyme
MSTHSAKVPHLAPSTIRPVRPNDRQPLRELVVAAEVFSPEELTSAAEIIDSAIAGKDGEEGYQLLVAEVSDAGALPQIAGYICYGHTPFTRSSFDLYCLATHPGHRRRGVARDLCVKMEELLRSRGGTHIRVETSGTAGYGAARVFYERGGYEQVARIPDFYKPGDDLYTFCKRL